MPISRLPYPVFHPDYTVGTGIPPVQSLTEGVADFDRR